MPDQTGVTAAGVRARRAPAVVSHTMKISRKVVAFAAVTLGLSTVLAQELRGALGPAMALPVTAPPAHTETAQAAVGLHEAAALMPHPMVSPRRAGRAAPNVVVAEMSTEWTTAYGTAWVVIPALSVTITTSGGPVMITANLNHNAIGEDGARGYFTIFRDEMNLGNANVGLQIAEGRGDSENEAVAIVYVDRPEPGTHTYSVRVRSGDGITMVSEDGQRAQLAAIELH